MSIVVLVGRQTARLRRLTAPHDWIRWFLLAIGALGLVVAGAAHRRQVDAARDAWGQRRPAWTVDAAIGPGETIVASPVEVPLALIPADSAEADPNGSTARRMLGAGEIVVAPDVAPTGPPGGLIPDGWLAAPVTEPTASGAVVGEPVVLASDGIVIADEAIVVAVLGGVPLVAVPADAAPLVALANESGVTVLRGP